MNGTGLRAQLFRRKPAAALMAEAESRSGGLKRALGALDLTLLGSVRSSVREFSC